ncbi:MAG: VOC family protein [Blastocatellia bacterium]
MKLFDMNQWRMDQVRRVRGNSDKDASGLVVFLMSATESLSDPKITLTIEVENVDSKYAELSSAGVQFVSPPKVQFWGYGAEVLDPSGYTNHLWDKVTMDKAVQSKN